MGLFDFLKPKKQIIAANQVELPANQPVLALQGPAYLRPWLEPAGPELLYNIKLYPDTDWTGQLVSANNNSFFTLRYFGRLLKRTFIAGIDELPSKVIAIASDTQEEILLFDKALHGYNGFICDDYKEFAQTDRPADNHYTLGSGKFRLLLVANYNDGGKEAILYMTEEDGTIKLDNGRPVPVQEAFDNAFDGLTIYAFDENGNRFEVISEELA